MTNCRYCMGGVPCKLHQQEIDHPEVFDLLAQLRAVAKASNVHMADILVTPNQALMWEMQDMLAAARKTITRQSALIATYERRLGIYDDL